MRSGSLVPSKSGIFVSKTETSKEQWICQGGSGQGSLINSLTSLAGGGLYFSVCHLPNKSIVTESRSWIGWFCNNKSGKKTRVSQTFRGRTCYCKSLSAPCFGNCQSTIIWTATITCKLTLKELRHRSCISKTNGLKKIVICNPFQSSPSLFLFALESTLSCFSSLANH